MLARPMNPGEGGAGVLSAQRLRRRVLSLGSAKAFDYAVQFLLPVVLVRCLDTTAFGHYRLLWVAVGTVLALAPMGMTGCLYYFLPRLARAEKRLYINQTLIFLSITGLIGAWAVSPWNPWLPEKMAGLADFGGLVPAFVLLWVVASMLDLLPTIEEQIAWQAKATVSLGAIRAATLATAAFITGELGPVLVALLGFVILKLAVLAFYIGRHHGIGGPFLRRDRFADQVKYAAPFGAAGGIHDMRSQSDLWVAAALFPIGTFASFSVGVVLSPLVHLFRQSVNSVFLPGMSRIHAEGNVPGMLALNSRANVMVAALLYPVLAFAFVFAEQLVTAVYTAEYLGAAPVMRVYIAGLVGLVVELASVMLLLRQGPYMLALNAVLLVLSVLASWFAARYIGLAGAAAGSVLATYLNCIVTLRHISRLTGIPIGRLQDWRTLGSLLMFAAVAGAIAWMVDAHFLASGGPFMRAIIGGAVLTVAYGAMHLLIGHGRRLFSAPRGP